MFGMGNNKFEEKANPSNAAFFDLELKMKDPVQYSQTCDHVQKKMGMLKTQMRQGEAKQRFDQLSELLEGYSALQKVLKNIKKNQK